VKSVRPGEGPGRELLAAAVERLGDDFDRFPARARAGTIIVVNVASTERPSRPS